MTIRMVVLDAYGVIFYEHGVEEPLEAYLRKNGCKLPQQDIWAQFYATRIGKASGDDFWRAIGIDPSGRDVVGEYLEHYSLTPGLLEFLDAMERAQIPVACISDACLEWAVRHRRKHGLEGRIAPWLVSGEMGLTKQEPEAYLRLLSATGQKADECLFADDRVVHLDVARGVGMQTVLFRSPDDAKGSAYGASEHPGVSTFAELEAMVLAGIRL